MLKYSFEFTTFIWFFSYMILDIDIVYIKVVFFNKINNFVVYIFSLKSLRDPNIHFKFFKFEFNCFEFFGQP